MKKLLIAALLLSSCLGSPAFADQVVKPATGSNFNTCTTLVSTTDITCVQLKTAAGTTIDPATSGNQSTANTSLSTIATNTTGAATAANQTTANGSLATIATNTTAAATAANQSTEISSLSTIATNTGAATPAGENHIGEVAGRTIIAGATFTTTSATTAWTAGQLIANSATAGSVTPLSFTVCRVNAGTGMVRRARIKVASDTGFVGASLTLYLYRDTPSTITNGDRGAWLTSESNYLGKIPVLLNNHFTDFEKGVGTPVDSSSNTGEINYDCGSGVQTISGLVVANGTITPAAGSKAISVVLETIVN